MRTQPKTVGSADWSCKKRGSQEHKLHNMGFLGAYVFIIVTFTCQHDQPVMMCSGRLKRGVLGTDTIRTKGVLGAG